MVSSDYLERGPSLLASSASVFLTSAYANALYGVRASGCYESSTTNSNDNSSSTLAPAHEARSNSSTYARSSSPPESSRSTTHWRHYRSVCQAARSPAKLCWHTHTELPTVRQIHYRYRRKSAAVRPTWRPGPHRQPNL